MSGGSWDYITFRIDEVADRLKGEKDPLRRLLGERVSLLAKVMHDIEWVDSGDKSDGDEIEAIKAFLSVDNTTQIRDEIEAVASRAKADIDTLRSLYQDSPRKLDSLGSSQ